MPSNTIATPRRWNEKALLIKQETTFGTDATPTGTEWIQALEVKLDPIEFELSDRGNEMPFMGSSGKLVGASWAKINFSVSLAPSGTAGTAPKFALLLKSAGFSETITASVSAAYTLVSSAIPSLTVYVYIAGVLHKLTGCRTNMKIAMTKGGGPKLSFDVIGLFGVSSDTSIPAITTTGWTLSEAVNFANTTPITLGATALAFSEMSFDLGNKIEKRNMPGQADVAISDRGVSGSMTVLAPTFGTFDPVALALNRTIQTMTMTHGSAAGKKCLITARVAIDSAAYVEIGGAVGWQLNFSCEPSLAGNDELSLTMQ